MPKSKQPTVSYAAIADSNKKVKPSPPPGIQSSSSPNQSQSKGLNGRIKPPVNNVPQPQSLAMDVQEQPSKGYSEIVVLPSLKLYETIETYKRVTLESRQHAVHQVMNNFVDESKNGSVVSVFKTPDSGVLTRLQSAANKRFVNGQKNHTKRHIISSTGRVAYSGRLDHSSSGNEEEFEVRVIYRLNKSDNSSQQTAAQSHMEWRDIKVGEDDGSSEAVSTVATPAAMDLQDAEGVKATTSGIESLKLGKIDSIDSGRTDFSSSSARTNADNNSNNSNNASGTVNSRINSNNNTVSRSTAKTGSFFKSTNPTPTASTFTNTKAPGYQQQHTVGVGVTGRAAAMAKMSSRGEEWPEEEELPGFSLPKTGSGLKAGGGVTKEVNKEVNKEVQRQQKLKSAKRG